MLKVWKDFAWQPTYTTSDNFFKTHRGMQIFPSPQQDHLNFHKICISKASVAMNWLSRSGWSSIYWWNKLFQSKRKKIFFCLIQMQIKLKKIVKDGEKMQEKNAESASTLRFLSIFLLCIHHEQIPASEAILLCIVVNITKTNL